jgi:phosphoglycerol geranylgeranyltransferase
MSSFLQEIAGDDKKRFALLIDPDKHTKESLSYLVSLAVATPPDLILVGGSLLFKPIEETIVYLKEQLNVTPPGHVPGSAPVPVFIFPGDISQLCDKADGILLLSLISGRNPEYLIGNHVIAAPRLKQSGIEVIPTAYMLIENGHSTSVEYISNTKPIPFGKTDLAVATALAGELLGLRLLYLEAGSGAEKSVGIDMISAISKAVNIPVVVGGGIRSLETAEKAYDAGADLIVIGSALEEYPEMLKDFAALRSRLNG